MGSNSCQISGFAQVNRTLAWNGGLTLRPENRAPVAPAASLGNCGTNTLLSLDPEQATNEAGRRTNSRFRGRTTSTPRIVGKIFPCVYYHRPDLTNRCGVIPGRFVSKSEGGEFSFEIPPPRSDFWRSDSVTESQLCHREILRVPQTSRFSQSSVPTFVARASCLRHSSPSSFL
jgi:hypothetical protein